MGKITPSLDVGESVLIVSAFYQIITLIDDNGDMILREELMYTQYILTRLSPAYRTDMIHRITSILKH